jgi:hypothetical protein
MIFIHWQLKSRAPVASPSRLGSVDVVAIAPVAFRMDFESGWMKVLCGAVIRMCSAKSFSRGFVGSTGVSICAAP